MQDPATCSLYGGYTRFELELEVLLNVPHSPTTRLTIRPVCSVSRKPLLPEPPGLPKAPSRSQLYRLYQILEILYQAGIYQISVVSGTNSQGFGVATARELPARYIES